MKKGLVTLLTFTNRAEVNLCKSILESRGIKAFIFDENIATTFEYLIAAGYYKIVISQDDVSVAKDILIENGIIKAGDMNDALSDNPCPKCSSRETDISKSGILFHILNVIFFLAPFLFRRRVYTCNKCGNVWRSVLCSHHVFFGVFLLLASVLVWVCIFHGVMTYIEDTARSENNRLSSKQLHELVNKNLQ